MHEESTFDSPFENASVFRSLLRGPDREGGPDLTPPTRTFPAVDGILALHWHPESVPLEVASARFRQLFPDAREWLMIPTEHNRLIALDGYSGVEVDCRHQGRKLQLLLHFRGDAACAEREFLQALDHTRAYRGRQLDQLLKALREPGQRSLREQLAGEQGCATKRLRWIEQQAANLQDLLFRECLAPDHGARKNKLVRDWLLEMLGGRSHPESGPVLAVLAAIKEQVKARFDPAWFESAEFWIGRTHALGGTVTLPHPELFPDMLQADLALDGVEVWNPQSWQSSRDLLADLVAGRIAGRPGFPVLPTFGDDCHLGEKRKPAHLRDEEKAGREIGVQPVWDWPGIPELLQRAGWTRVDLVRLWKRRLSA